MIQRAIVRTGADSWQEYSRPRWSRFVSPTDLTGERLVAVLDEVERHVEETGDQAVGFIGYDAAAAWGYLVPGAAPSPAGAAPPVPAMAFTTFAQVTPWEENADDQRYTCTPWTPSLSRDEYRRRVQRIRDHLAAGDTYQVNFTFPMTARFSGSPLHLFADICRSQDGLYSAYLELENGVSILSASPELYLQRRGSQITSLPMKGTAPRGLTNAADAAAIQGLRESAKERAENLMITDMIRNDLGRVAEIGTVQVPELFTVERYPRVLQMVSRVQARTDASLATVLKETFPCASITGAPKKRTMEIIAELEESPRGVYTGAIGVISPGREMRLSVAIRTVVLDGNDGTAVFGVGSGILWDSDADLEYAECALKASILSAPQQPFALLETMRWNRSAGVTLWEGHLRRLRDSAHYFKREVPPDVTDHQAVHRHLCATVPPGEQDWRVRLLVHRDGSWQTQAFPLESAEGVPTRRVALASRPVDTASIWVHHKTTERQIYLSFLDEHKDEHNDVHSAVDDVILWNPQGEVTETCTASVVLQREDGSLVTPPLECGLLPGVFRAHLLGDGAPPPWTPGGARVEEGIITLEEIREMHNTETREMTGRKKTLYLVNSVRGWMRAVLPLLAVIFLFARGPAADVSAQEAVTIPVTYYGDISCTHCDIIQDRVLPELQERFAVTFEVTAKDILYREVRNEAEARLDELGLPYLTAPVLLVGNNAYQGNYAIEQQLPLEVEHLLADGTFRPFDRQGSLTQRGDVVSTGAPGQEGVLRFFWGVGCPYCEQAKPLLETLEQRYPALVVERYELFESRQHHDLFQEHLVHYGVNSTGVPQFFFGERHWIGFSPQVSRDLEGTIVAAMEEAALDGPAGEPPAQPPQTLDLPFGRSLALASLPAVVMTVAIAFVDGFNPCSLWVLTLLLGLIVHTRSRRKILLVGAVFLAVTAGIYGLFMLGMLNVFMIAGVSGPVRWIVATLAITMGLINAKDYLFFKRGFSLTIPERFKRPIAAGTRKVQGATGSTSGLIAATALFAAAVAIVELPCTAGFPVLWSQYVVAAVAPGSLSFWGLLLLYLFVYLLIEIVIITIAVVTLGRVAFAEREARKVKLVGGAIMVSLGVHYLVNPEIANTLAGVGRIFLAAIAGAVVLAVVAALFRPGPTGGHRRS